MGGAEGKEMGKGMGEAREEGGVREERTCVRYCGAGTMSRLRTIYAHTCTLIIILNYILHTHTHTFVYETVLAKLI